ncbi:transposase family protein [Nocardioides sp.]|uniref:integrase catalytic domain-containing protein n=1 Tax=Nocardioides sp. TaxID=35761 RepID=UPI002D7FFB5D|nr:transposase family protein [Nocardioides sp.]HET8958868.1 transposase family protein [Nocardioides sp.]
MESELSMASRAEITTRYAKGYARASKKDKGRVLDEVVAVTGWSRDNARRRLVAAAKLAPGAGRAVARRPRKQRADKFSYDARLILQRVWAASGGQCGKYLAASMAVQLDALQRHGELVLDGPGSSDPEGRYSPSVRAELLAMSAATIDRYLAPAKAKDGLRGTSTTKPGPLLRTSITIRRAGDEVEAEPGFFEGDTVAHCGPSLKGEFARTVNLTDVHTGWTFTRSIRNNAHTHILGALQQAVEPRTGIPFEVTGLDFDNGSEFLNHAVVGWAGQRGIYFTRSRPYKKNDQATIESKNGHLVRRYGFYYRYDTSEERTVLNRLWRLVNDRLNYLTPTIKPVGYASTSDGRRTRRYDKPQTPFDRLLAANVLAPAQITELTTYRDSLNPAAIGRQIADLQTVLLKLAKDKTDQLYLASIPSALPDVRKGIRVSAS